MEAQVLASCLSSRTAYDVVIRLGGDSDLSLLGQQLLKQVTAYYDKDDTVQAVDKSVLLSIIQAALPHHYDKFERVVEVLPEPSPANVIEALKQQRLTRLNAEITQNLAGGKTEEAKTLMSEWQQVEAEGITEREEEKDDLLSVRQGASLTDVTASLREGSKFKLIPNAMHELVDGLMPGDHIVLFGQVNRGKSAIAINVAAGFASQGHRVLFIGNEDPADRMLTRIICRFCGKTRQQVMEDTEHYTALALKRGYGNILFKEMSPGTTSEVRKLVAHHRPDVVIIDQARNLVPDTKSSGATDTQEAIFYELRMILKKYKALGISCTQAGERDLHGKPLEEKLQLEQNDVYQSKSGIASQADVMIGIGATKPMLDTGQRYLNVCKNKASGIHDGVMIWLDPFTGIIKAD